MERYQRDSGIELLKIFAIILIVISHVAQTLSSINENFVSNYVIDVTVASKNITNFVLLFFRYFGQQGNYIFFVCSAWFLVESNNTKGKKIATMLIDTWLVSVIILVIFLIVGEFSLSIKSIVHCVFPTTYANNWYITCYLLFYAIHPALNIVIKNLERRQFFISVCVMIFIYFGVSFLLPGTFYNSSLISFIVMYFVVAFLKIHAFDFCQNKRLNFILLTIALFLHFTLLFVTNFLGLYITLFQNQLMRWCGTNPFLLIIAITLLNLFRQCSFSSKAINYISSLSLLIYIIHENILVRTYLRPVIWIWIKSEFGYSQVVLWVLLFSIVLFFVATILAIIYKETFGRIIQRILGQVHKII